VTSFYNKNQIIRTLNQEPPVYYPTIHHNWSHNVRVRFGKTCQICKNNDLTVAHHLFYRIFYPELINSLNNGICLCDFCESQVHGHNLLVLPNLPYTHLVPNLKPLSYYQKFLKFIRNVLS
jgi:hypothetical protein